MPYIGNCKIYGRPNLEGEQQYTQISTINMFIFIEIRQYILIQCHGNYMEMKTLNNMLEFDISSDTLQNNLGALRGAF